MITSQASDCTTTRMANLQPLSTGGAEDIKTPVSEADLTHQERKMQLDKNFIRDIVHALAAIWSREHGNKISTRRKHQIVRDAVKMSFVDHENFIDYLWAKLSAPCLTSV